MATLDLLTPAEVKLALNIEAADTSQDAELASYNTAVSQRLDELCGAIIKRTVTAEQYPGAAGYLALRYAPASKTAATTITSVTEYNGGTAQVLAAEALTSSTSYDFAFEPTTGILSRRATWSEASFGAQRVVVTYSAGRYADTASVAPKFKQAAAIMLSHLWRGEQGVGGSATFGAQGELGIPTFAVPNAVLELLADEIQPPATA